MTGSYFGAARRTAYSKKDGTKKTLKTDNLGLNQIMPEKRRESKLKRFAGQTAGSGGAE